MISIIKGRCCLDQQATSVISLCTNVRASVAEKCERQVRCCESTCKVRDALKEEPSNSMVDFLMQMAKVLIVRAQRMVQRSETVSKQ